MHTEKKTDNDFKLMPFLLVNDFRLDNGFYFCVKLFIKSD